jgi:hypothetical protein
MTYVTCLCFTNVPYVVDFTVVLTLQGINPRGINPCVSYDAHSFRLFKILFLTNLIQKL